MIIFSMHDNIALFCIWHQYEAQTGVWYFDWHVADEFFNSAGLFVHSLFCDVFNNGDDRWADKLVLDRRDVNQPLRLSIFIYA